MHTIKITANLLFEYQYTNGKFISLANRIETCFARIGMLYYIAPARIRRAYHAHWLNIPDVRVKYRLSARQ